MLEINLEKCLELLFCSSLYRPMKLLKEIEPSLLEIKFEKCLKLLPECLKNALNECSVPRCTMYIPMKPLKGRTSLTNNLGLKLYNLPYWILSLKNALNYCLNA